MNEIINLTTERLVIRDLNYLDLNFIHLIHSISEVQEYATLDIPQSIGESELYLEKYLEQQNYSSRKEYGFCISLINQESIGLIGLNSGLNKFRKCRALV